MAEGITPREEYRQLNRSLTEKVLDRAASDPAWKERYLDDPDAAMREAQFPEVQQIEQVRQRVDTEQAEVMGQQANINTVTCTLGQDCCRLGTRYRL